MKICLKCLLAAASAACLSVRAAEPLDPTNFVRAVVSITRNFTPEEIARKPRPAGAVGADVSATAWFYRNDRFLVTAGHFVDDSSIGTNQWTDVVLEQENKNGWLVERKETVHVRLFASVYTTSVDEPLAVLELQRPFTNAQVLAVRSDHLYQGAKVMSIAYPNENLRFGYGTFMGVLSEGFSGIPAGSHAFEVSDGMDRKVVDIGASGGPVMDEDGRVVGVLEQMAYQDVSVSAFFGGMSSSSASIRTSSAWGQPDCSAIPTEALQWLVIPDLDTK